MQYPLSINVIKSSKVRMSRYLDTSTEAQLAKIMVQYGRPSRSSRNESVRSSSGRTYGKGILRKFSWNTVGTNYETGNAYQPSKRTIPISVDGRYQNGR